MANPVFADMVEDLLSSNQFGSDTAAFTVPGISTATVDSASVQRSKTIDNEGELSRGQPVKTDITVKVLVADLPASYQGLSEDAWTRGEVSVSGINYGIDEALVRHGYVRLMLGGEMLQERSRANMRR